MYNEIYKNQTLHLLQNQTFKPIWNYPNIIPGNIFAWNIKSDHGIFNMMNNESLDHKEIKHIVQHIREMGFFGNKPKTRTKRSHKKSKKKKID